MERPWRKIKLSEYGWSWEQAEMFVGAAKDKVGGETAWRFLGEGIQAAMLAQECLSVVCLNALDEQQTYRIVRLRSQMLVVAGLLPLDDFGFSE